MTGQENVVAIVPPVGICFLIDRDYSILGSGGIPLVEAVLVEMLDAGHVHVSVASGYRGYYVVPTSPPGRSADMKSWLINGGCRRACGSTTRRKRRV